MICQLIQSTPFHTSYMQNDWFVGEMRTLFFLKISNTIGKFTLKLSFTVFLYCILIYRWISYSCIHSESPHLNNIDFGFLISFCVFWLRFILYWLNIVLFTFSCFCRRFKTIIAGSALQLTKFDFVWTLKKEREKKILLQYYYIRVSSAKYQAPEDVDDTVAQVTGNIHNMNFI